MTALVAPVHGWRAALLGRLGASRFARNLWLVLRANVIAQALPVLVAPVLTRLYAPADFGVLALFAAALGVGLAVGTARFEWSVPNARSAGMAAALLVLGTLVLGVSVLVLTAVWSAHAAFGLAGSWNMLGGVGWLLPLALLGAGAQQLLQAWHVRSAELSSLGRAKVTQSIGNVVVSLAAAGVGAWGLIAGVLAGAWIGLATLWRGARGLPQALGTTTRPRVAVAWVRFRGEAGWSTLSSVLNSVSFAVVPLLLARHHGLVEVGYYALVQRIALAPIGVLGSAVSQSFWAEASTLVRSDPRALDALYKRGTLRMAVVALPFALLALAGPWYVGPLFGAGEWHAAGGVLAATAPLLFAQAAASPLSHLVIHRRQHWQALWDLARIALLASTIELLGRAGTGFTATVLAVSLVMSLMYLVLVGLNVLALKRAAGR